MGRLLAVLVAALLLAACAPGSNTGPVDTVTVKLTDNKISLDHPTVAAGTVSVTVSNTGVIAHSVDLIRTDLAHDRLPPDPNDQSRVQITGMVKSFGVLSPGTSASFSATLDPGQYVFLCNEPAHYLIGMHIALTVK